MTNSRLCPSCHTPAPEGDRFCQLCGVILPEGDARQTFSSAHPDSVVWTTPVAPVSPQPSWAAPGGSSAGSGFSWAAPGGSSTPVAPGPERGQRPPPQPSAPSFPATAPHPPVPPSSPGPESVIGHLPAEYIVEGGGVFGGSKRTQVNLVITSTRLLCLAETEQTNTTWLAETERLEEDASRTGVPWRTLMDYYPWAGPLWASFFRTPPEVLLAESRSNWAVPWGAVVEATVTLDPELDRLDLLMDNRQVLRFALFNLVGVVAARLLGQVLGANRVRLVPEPSH